MAEKKKRTWLTNNDVQTRSNNLANSLPELGIELIGGCIANLKKKKTQQNKSKTNVAFQMKFEEFDHPGHDSEHRGCFSSSVNNHVIHWQYTRQPWQSSPLSHEAYSCSLSASCLATEH